MNQQQQKSIPTNLLPSVIAYILSIGFVILFTLIGWWQVIWVGPLVGSFLFLKTRNGILLGVLSITVVWSVYLAYYIITNSLLLLYDQLGVVILGSSGNNWIFIIGILVIGGVFGILGGWCGSSLRQFFLLYMKDYLQKKRESPK